MELPVQLEERERRFPLPGAQQCLPQPVEGAFAEVVSRGAVVLLAQRSISVDGGLNYALDPA